MASWNELKKLGLLLDPPKGKRVRDATPPPDENKDLPFKKRLIPAAPVRKTEAMRPTTGVGLPKTWVVPLTPVAEPPTPVAVPPTTVEVPLEPVEGREGCWACTHNAGILIQDGKKDAKHQGELLELQQENHNLKNEIARLWKVMSGHEQETAALRGVIARLDGQTPYDPSNPL